MSRTREVEVEKETVQAANPADPKLNQSTRVVKIDVYYTIRPFTITPGTKVD